MTENYECKKCETESTADKEGDLDCSECGGDEMEGFVDLMYEKEREYIGELAEAARTSRKGTGTQEQTEK